jgi:hypothetical protein
MSLKFPVRPMTFGEVKMLASPASALQPEVIPWAYYDTQTLASLWTSASFFATPQNDRTLGNIEQGGQIPADTWFQIWSFNLDFLIPAVDVNATAEAVDDVLQILYGARAAMQLTIANKNYGPIPLTFLHGSGGARVTLANSDATATTIANHAQNEAPDGGWWVDGAIILPPNQSFTVQLIGNSAALNASRQVRLSMVGVKYRPLR